VITEAGNEPEVRGLVYIAAGALDRAPHPECHPRPLRSEPLARDADSNQNDDKVAENPPEPRVRMTSNLSPLAKVRSAANRWSI
jgi:hypothetical protein